ncbi:MAG: sulfatase [Planctomycetia bacterium]|nr:sulfatase [Planctomycetia bacterium]
MLSLQEVGWGQPADTEKHPNIILIYADDMGYADLGCFGSTKHRTPHLDSLAKEGARLTQFYTAQAVCSASRAALLTGCYPNRIGILGALNHRSTHGINNQELTLPEMLKSVGYQTAHFGKWHLGHLLEFLPTRHGFDIYFGIPYSNDMWPNHPTAGKYYPDLPLYDGTTVIETNPDQRMLTSRFTQRAVDFIQQQKDKRFFIYLAHPMPHVPLHVSPERAGKSAGGLYGDVIEEIDWSTGQILATLSKLGLDEKTLVIFASDNGPWLSYGNHAGSAGKLREGKGTSFEGGVRVPFLARWPDKIPAGLVSNEPAMTIDILPTLAKLTGASLPTHPIDGKDIMPLLTSFGAKSPHEALNYFWDRELQAVRSGPWKLHLPHRYQTLKGKPGKDGKPDAYEVKQLEKSLFNIENDPEEKNNLLALYPDVVVKLMRYVDAARKDLGDSQESIKGTGVREPGKLKFQ